MILSVVIDILNLYSSIDPTVCYFRYQLGLISETIPRPDAQIHVPPPLRIIQSLAHSCRVTHVCLL